MDEQVFSIFALPGTKEWVRCDAWNAPEGFVRMNDFPPMDGLGNHIADPTGEWVVPSETYVESYNENVSRQRQLEYLKVIPIEKQLEAITEFHMGRVEKLNEVVASIQEIKLKYPKM